MESFTEEEITEDLAEVGIIRLFIKVERAGVVEVDGKLVWEAIAENLSSCSYLLLHDEIVLLVIGSSLNSLPWERAAAEVKQDIPKRFHVITTRLLHGALITKCMNDYRRLTNAQVVIDRGISRSSSQVFFLTVWYVGVSVRVTVLLCKTKINDIDLMATLANAHEEIVRLDITVND